MTTLLTRLDLMVKDLQSSASGVDQSRPNAADIPSSFTENLNWMSKCIIGLDHNLHIRDQASNATITSHVNSSNATITSNVNSSMKILAQDMKLHMDSKVQQLAAHTSSKINQLKSHVDASIKQLKSHGDASIQQLVANLNVKNEIEDLALEEAVRKIVGEVVVEEVRGLRDNFAAIIAGQVDRLLSAIVDHR